MLRSISLLSVTYDHPASAGMTSLHQVGPPVKSSAPPMSKLIPGKIPPIRSERQQSTENRSCLAKWEIFDERTIHPNSLTAPFFPADKPAGHHQGESMRAYSRSRYDLVDSIALDRPYFPELNRPTPAHRGAGTSAPCRTGRKKCALPLSMTYKKQVALV